jgi:hypothetical protein
MQMPLGKKQRTCEGFATSATSEDESNQGF